jgi:hypothetical protein
MNIATSMTPRNIEIHYWNRGRKSEEQGWSFNGLELTMGDLISVRSFNELCKKGVPIEICNMAKKEGYYPSELSIFLSDFGY